ncbi:MAG TPA: helix-turn-helix transcriptional regulator [Candidatus Binataceae bacterium]|nr:helix-turn-helix transcriptional regulator [Candidatus Binataceae bacterium]
MGRKKEQRSFGQLLRERRRKLDLTQNEVARRIKTSTPYVGHLEAGKRHPSDKVIARLAEVLGLERRELFFLANPAALELVQTDGDGHKASAWDEFRRDDHSKRLHNISSDEMDILEKIARLGEISAARDFIYILNTIRHALGR